jgi:hypothetical protein
VRWRSIGSRHETFGRVYARCRHHSFRRSVFNPQPRRSCHDNCRTRAPKSLRTCDLFVALSCGAIRCLSEVERCSCGIRACSSCKSRFEFLLSKSLRKYGSGFVTTGVDLEQPLNNFFV